MNKLFSIVLIMMLSLPVSVWAADDVVEEPMASPIVNKIDANSKSIHIINNGK